MSLSNVIEPWPNQFGPYWSILPYETYPTNDAMWTWTETKPPRKPKVHRKNKLNQLRKKVKR